jgi:hypothetical protein
MNMTTKYKFVINYPQIIIDNKLYGILPKRQIHHIHITCDHDFFGLSTRWSEPTQAELVNKFTAYRCLAGLSMDVKVMPCYISFYFYECYMHKLIDVMQK